MKRTIQQVFGTTRPRDIFSGLLTFDRLVTRPIVHIVYWAGLGLLFIAAMAILGMAVGSAIKDSSPMGILLSFPLLIVGWLGVLIGVLVWRSICEFYMAVMSIADDLRYPRQFQEKLDPGVAVAAPAAQPAAQTTAQAFTPKVDPMNFEVPTPDAYAEVADKETGDILDDPFFRPRFKPE